nr:uncharacterized protein LOC104092427 [Nicotiana tomentosiformis]
MAACVAEVIWLVGLLQDLGVPISRPIQLHCDSKTAIQITANPTFHERTKYNDIDCHLVREKVKEGFIQTKYLATQSQIADLLTKAVVQVPNADSRSKEWIKGICKQMSYFEREWCKLSNGKWEACSHDLPKTTELRLLDEDDPSSLAEPYASDSPELPQRRRKRRKAMKKVPKPGYRTPISSSDSGITLRMMTCSSLLTGQPLMKESRLQPKKLVERPVPL